MSDSREDLKFDSQEDIGLGRFTTAGSMVITPEMFESMFLAPKMPVRGELRTSFGNPTPVALAGFLLCTTPLSMVLLGWRGAGGLGAAEVGNYFFFGGMLLTLGGIGEFLLGNTFPQVVFLSFGGFWFTLGATLTPSFNAYGAYSTTTDPADGLKSTTFFNSYAFFFVAMVLLCAVLMIASIRTNIVFFGIFFLLVPAFSCLAGAFFALGQGATVTAASLQHAGAGLLLVLTIFGWYIFLALVLLSVDFPVKLPLGDLSTVVRGRTDRQRAKKEHV